MSAVIVTTAEELQSLISNAVAPLHKELRRVKHRIKQMQPDEYISLAEAQKIMMLKSRSSVYDWIHDGLIKNYGDNHKPLFLKSEVTTARKRKANAKN
jgi:F0F1-type ATP synthase membrane subunit b/b'